MLIKIHELDNVGVLENGHKQALEDIKKGEKVIKYGFPIGFASADIKKGEPVHSHNLKSGLKGVLEYRYEPSPPIPLSFEGSGLAKTFMGYRRKDGSVGVRNEVWIINTVGCVNKTCEKLAAEADRRFGAAYETDGFYAFAHPHGCSQLGDDHERTRKVLAGLVMNPNAGGVLVVGLGCEYNFVDAFKETLGGYDPGRVKFMVAQETDDEIGTGLALLEELAAYASAFKRSVCGVSELKAGLKCGGSDGFSGLTANPAAGGFSDRLISFGGAAALTEVPEMFGAETILMNRCVSEEIFNKTAALINNYKQYYMRYGQPVYENPSPGNKAGGITTLEEKSLGCVQKGGTSPVTDVIGVGERIKTKGLTLVDGPGNDIVASTSLAAAGCQLILFTTGRGTPYGAPVPTVKISTNAALAEKKPHWIDFNAHGAVAHGAAVVADRLYEYVIKVASGERTKNELHGYREIAIFKDGVTL